METLTRLLYALLPLLLAPLLTGSINRTKAVFAGRNGQPLLQSYYDILKLLRKGAVYSGTTTWVFRAGPVVALAAVATASLLVPFGGSAAPVACAGDFILLAYLLGLARWVTTNAALDTGSAFCGMGASREVQFAALAEPALLLGLGAVAWQTRHLSLSEMYGSMTAAAWWQQGPALLMVAAALAVVVLVENARIPFDDPNTHLELTMIHEVMVLDHGGPDFALVQYGAALKLWVTSALVVGLLLPVQTGSAALDLLIALAGMAALAIAIGVVESVMARVRLLRVPQLLAGAGALSFLALLLVQH